MRNEVVFQAYGDLVEVANEAEKGNKETLLTYFDDAEKIWRMYQIAQDNGFTSFAEA